MERFSKLLRLYVKNRERNDVVTIQSQQPVFHKLLQNGISAAGSFLSGSNVASERSDASGSPARWAKSIVSAVVPVSAVALDRWLLRGRHGFIQSCFLPRSSLLCSLFPQALFSGLRRHRRVRPCTLLSMVRQSIDNVHGTGLETCHVSALNACKTKRPLRVTGIRTSQVSERCCLYNHIICGILYLKDRSGSCGTILKKPWGL